MKRETNNTLSHHSQGPAFTIIIPVFNEENGIAGTIEQIQDSLRSFEADYELIVVNDGSTDETEKQLRNLADVKVLKHATNRGYGAALKTGIRHANAEFVVITDADGTYPNHRIGELVALCADQDMVVGSRTGESVQYPLIRKIPKYFLKKFAEWMARQSIPDMNSGLRVFRKDVAERFLNILPDGFSFTTTITIAMLANRYQVLFVPIDYSARIGKSKIKPIRDTLRFTQLILRTGMYFAPLRVFLPIGLFFFFLFVVSSIYDILVNENLTDKTLIFMVAGAQVVHFSLLADMIDKRVG